MSRHYAYALMKDDAEFAVLRTAAKAEGLCISNYVRRAINCYLLEVHGEHATLLEETEAQRPGRPAGRARPGTGQEARRAG